MKSALRKYTPEGEILNFEDDALKKLSSPDLDAIRFIWDETQEGLKCCGVDSYKDWQEATQWVKNHSGDVPGVMTAYYLLIHSLCSTRLIIFIITRNYSPLRAPPLLAPAPRGHCRFHV